MFDNFVQTATWIAGANGNWETGSSWSTGVPPQPGDNVIIQNNYVVTVNSVININDLTLSAGTLRFAAGSGATISS